MEDWSPRQKPSSFGNNWTGPMNWSGKLFALGMMLPLVAACQTTPTSGTDFMARTDVCKVFETFRYSRHDTADSQSWARGYNAARDVICVVDQP